MTFNFANDGNQRRVTVDTGTAADMSDELTILALTYIADVSAATATNYLWKDCHARGFGRAGSALYAKFNGTNPATLHEMQTANGVLQTGMWQWVAIRYRFSDSTHNLYWAPFGKNLEEVLPSALDLNTRVGMEDNSVEPMLVGSRQLATYNYDRNWGAGNSVAIVNYWNSLLTLDEIRLQQDMLYPRVGTPLWMHVYGSDLVSNVPDLSGNGYVGVLNNVTAGTAIPSGMRASASDPMSIIPFRSMIVTPGNQGAVGVFVGSTNGSREKALVVNPSISADVVFHLRADMPPVMPTGTMKLRLRPIAAATTGDAKVNPKWLAVAPGESADPTVASYNAEGVTTISWAAGDSEKMKTETLITLDADTIAAKETLYMRLTFETSGWTLAAAKSYWLVDLIFE